MDKNLSNTPLLASPLLKIHRIISGIVFFTPIIYVLLATLDSLPYPFRDFAHFIVTHPLFPTAFILILSYGFPFIFTFIIVPIEISMLIKLYRIKETQLLKKLLLYCTIQFVYTSIAYAIIYNYFYIVA